MTTEKRTLEDVRKTIDEILVQFEIDATENSKVANVYEKTLLKIGEELVYVSCNMTNSEFAILKEETAKKLGNDASNINKVVKIAKNRAIMEHKDDLPTGWASLYLLTKIEPKDFNNFMAESGVNTKTTRKELGEMIDDFKGTAASTKESAVRLVIKPAKSVSSKSLIEIEPLLSDFLLQYGWEIVKAKRLKTAVAKTRNVELSDIVSEENAENEAEYQQQDVA